MLSVSVTLKAVYGWRSGKENGDGVVREISGKFPGKPCPAEKKNDLGFNTYFTFNKQLHFVGFCLKQFLELVNILIVKQNHRTLSGNLKIGHTVHHQFVSLNQACKFQVTC